MSYREFPELSGSIATGAIRIGLEPVGLFISATDAPYYANALGKILRTVPSPFVQQHYAEATATSKLIDLLCSLEQT
ncbi:MAG: hypothetical protein JWM11_6326 [Planctomycetaceae bacterium]|nr:hypothetical protein [Planctomycetaceae bacterium]